MKRFSSMAPGPEQVAHWEEHWRRCREESFLGQSQRQNPAGWQKFYDQVSPVWERLTGSQGRTGERVANLILEQGLARPGARVLEVGCGPGSLALALAGQGVRVRALDNSPGMIQTLEQRARQQGLTGIETLVCDWAELAPEPEHDLVCACFFPQAMSPAGLARLESHAWGRCLVILGDGRETFPWRRLIWEKVMEQPCATAGFHLDCAFNYLAAAGREPCQEPLAWPVSLDLAAEEVRAYFSAYFAIFGCQGPELARAIDQALEPFRQGDRVRVSGVSSLAALWWPAPGAEAV